MPAQGGGGSITLQSCDPNTLAGQAACLRCIPPGAFDRIRTYLLCQLAAEITDSMDEGGANLIAGQVYAGNGHRFAFLNATAGEWYRIVWGVNDASASVGNGNQFNPGVGTTSLLIASKTEIDFYGFSNGPVTAQLYAV